MKLQKNAQMQMIEEVANSALHAIGFGLAITCLIVLVMRANLHGDAWFVVSVSVYGATLVLLYLASTLAHALYATKAGPVLELIDRSAVYLLIAGSYTPFTLTVLRGGWGWSLFGTIWGLALLGVMLAIFSHWRYSSATCILYLLMGWTIVVAAAPLIRLLPLASLLWLLLGGIAYSGGVLFFLSQKLFRHTLWHACVLCGSTCHFLAVLSIMPR